MSTPSVTRRSGLSVENFLEELKAKVGNAMLDDAQCRTSKLILSCDLFIPLLFTLPGMEVARLV